MFDNTQDVLSDSTEARHSESTSLFGEAMQLLGSQQFRSNEGMQTSGQNSLNQLFGSIELFDSQDDGSLVLSSVKGKPALKPQGERSNPEFTQGREIEVDRDRALRPDRGEPNNVSELDKSGLRRAVQVDEDGLTAREIEFPEGGGDLRDAPPDRRNPEDRFIDHTQPRDGKPSEVIDAKTLPNGKVRSLKEVDDDGLTAREVEFDIEVED